MSSLVKERIIEIVDSYPIGERFTINTVHRDMFLRHGISHLPSRAVIDQVLVDLPYVKSIRITLNTSLGRRWGFVRESN